MRVGEETDFHDFFENKNPEEATRAEDRWVANVLKFKGLGEQLYHSLRNKFRTGAEESEIEGRDVVGGASASGAGGGVGATSSSASRIPWVCVSAWAYAFSLHVSECLAVPAFYLGFVILRVRVVESSVSC